MSFEVWSAYALTTILILVIPGPTVLLLIGFGLSEGRRAALYCAAGVMLGDCTLMTLSLIGVGAVLAASAMVFSIMKMAGACYLVYLGWRMWRGAGKAGVAAERPPRRSGMEMLRRSWFVTALNPKAITFFVAFMPQFIHTDKPIVPQLVVMGGTLVCLSFLNSLCYTYAAGTAGRIFANPQSMKYVRRGGGCSCMAAGIWTMFRESQ